MPIRQRHIALVLLIVLFCSVLVQTSQTHLARAQDTTSQVYLPLISVPPPRNPFGFTLSMYSSDQVLNYGAATQPRWARAGDVLWSKIEATRGVYDWSSLAPVESNIRRLRQQGIEPTLVIQQSPSWAQRTGGRFCSPPKAEYLKDLANFAYALAARYSQGELQVNYWEFWNEPDVLPQDIGDEAGVGCWADASQPDYGGRYYAEALRNVYPAIKNANASATVIAGALLYGLVDDTVSAKPHISELFVDGIFSSGGGAWLDGMSFHAYGEYGASSMLVAKTLRLQAQLEKYGLGYKKLYATELASMCAGWDSTQCAPNYNQWLYTQANYAARIYAEALALKLDGAFWYSLSSSNPGFRFSHLIDEENGAVTLRPSYYAFYNSAHLLSSAEYIGPPITELSSDQLEKVQMLKFKKPKSILYVLWVPRIDAARPDTIYRIPVTPGSKAYCVQTLNKVDSWKTPYECTDTNNDGLINVAVNSNPFYVEVPNQ